MNNNDAKKIIDILTKTYPDAQTALNFNTPFELLIATILSAQCTDERVNLITDKLFKKANTPNQMLEIGVERLIEYIQGAGLYKNKSKNIIKTCELLVSEHGGCVPDNRKDLENLPGVGRKTANVVLANAFNQPTLAVDTHVFRVARRMGLSKGDTVLDVEKDLMEILPKTYWIDAHHTLIFHGRNRCKARSPQCKTCEVQKLCLQGEGK
ncbi:endonuclease III [Natranaerobius trueperi]|uniref:Endonuclease III n=1 Tax=Natranaerobius trueperi TaxID=759412 RepID=A0A226C2S8_9FIRM|nr:endonuclease III [Natranaerobius trueperi]OWZ84707.1 endonuclease III [Natranaerobius trueperi]